MSKKWTLKVERYSKYDEPQTDPGGIDADQPMVLPGNAEQAFWLAVLAAPFIYAMFLPALLMDVCVSVFQWICCPVFRIRRVERGQFFVFDRHKLHYLNSVQKFNCAFCSYFNSVISYTQEVASLTEQRFCPIKHRLKPRRAHKRYDEFSEYADAEGFRARVIKRRNSAVGQQE